ncbi:RNA helicase [Butyrivibrio hungatei DSM 14810]|uniref:ATP-dependent helicase Rep n=1 Tax=Butyrivibrio hungatei DSM 14810 TaxID=1121132 RepID=A0A1M7SSB2_9FIRM|nr:hypothetical protein [Butyrivibrio hungatei]SHN61294.1 RNA helicase [Butyrivibrio hungatei DSM 14810]
MAIKQARKFLITQNNPQEYGIKSLEDMIDRAKKLKGLLYAIVCFELGKQNSTPHFHLFVIFKNPKSWQTMKNIFPYADIEGALGTNIQCRDYVLKRGKWENTEKEDTRVDGQQLEYGEMPSDRDSVDPKAELLLKLIEDGHTDYEIMTDYPEFLYDLSHIQRIRLTLRQAEYQDIWRNVQVFYIYGAPGLGKTRMIMDGFGYKNVFRVTDTNHPWDTYQGEDVVIFEEFASTFKIQDMNNYLDSYPLKLTARYSDRIACYTKVFVISNQSIKKQYPNIQNDWEQSSKDTYRAFLRRFTGIIKFLDNHNLEYYEMDKEQHPKYIGLFSHQDFLNKLKAYLTEGSTIAMSPLSSESIVTAEELIQIPQLPQTNRNKNGGQNGNN